MKRETISALNTALSHMENAVAALKMAIELEYNTPGDVYEPPTPCPKEPPFTIEPAPILKPTPIDR